MERDFAASKMSLLAKERLAESDISIVSSLCAKHPSISFSAGEPDAAFYPTAELKEAFSLALDDPSILNYYPSDMGYAPLRKWLAEWMVSEGTAPSSLSDKNILLTHGAAEAINSVTEIFLEPGAIVAVEEASYVEALMNFRKQGAFCLGVPMDEDGIIPEKFEALCDSNHITMFYTVPCFQNPTGRTTSLARRKAVLDICARNEIMILEDDPYRYLNYGAHLPDTYFAMSGGENVIYCSSFSKIIAPGIRLGWLALPDALREKFELFQICNGLIQQPLTHKAAHIYLKRHDFSSRVKFLTDEYAKKRDIIVAEIHSQLEPLGMEINCPSGGFFLWGTIAGIDDMFSFVRHAIVSHGVSIVPGSPFIADGVSGKNTCRLSLSKITHEAAKEGCRRLAEAINAYR